MLPPLNQVLARWEASSPIIHADEVRGDFSHIFETLYHQKVLLEIAPAGAIDCTECGQRVCLSYVPDESGTKRGFIHCPSCGIANVPDDRLKRWEIQTHSFLETIFSDLNGPLQERTARRLWQVGKSNWAGRTREVWFARSYRRDQLAMPLQELGRRPKAILFAPTESGAGQWQQSVSNVVLALESVLSFHDGEICFDTEYVESRIIDAGLATESTPKRPPKKRSQRTANIEILRKEVIEHLRAARDHAFHTKETTGTPEFLPRPTQKELGKRVELSESDVSRCLNDSNGHELRIYWDIANDLHQIMSWAGPIKMGRKS